MSDHTKTEAAGLVWLKWSTPIVNSFPQETHELLSSIIEDACEQEREACAEECDALMRIAEVMGLGNGIAGCACEAARKIRARGGK